MTRTRVVQPIPGGEIAAVQRLGRAVNSFTAERLEQHLACSRGQDRREIMSRLALTAAAVIVTASGLAFGASTAIGPRNLAALAFGASVESAAPPGNRVVAAASHPARGEVRGIR
ncbi:unnamed protein product [marine sediment metagenome]|uniref:Uncharacterized protein n=1 Tax=marine sediment metagenome TaxID=412755 RepID=X0UEY8_9ZZZZ